MSERLTYKSVEVRAVAVPLKRPVIAKVGSFKEWPLILIDLCTHEGIVGRSYLGPYLKNAARYVIPAIRDLAAALIGKPVAPLENFQLNRRSLNLIGYEGAALIAVSGLDMAAWDALAKAAGMPLAVLLGGSLGPVPAYNSNGLWLKSVDALAKEAGELVAEGGFKALKLRLGRERLADDLTAIREVRKAAGDDVKLMVDFNQGLTLGDALARCHALDERRTLLVRGADRLRQPRRLRAARPRTQDAGAARRKFLWAARPLRSDPRRSRRLRHARSHAYWRRERLVARGGGGGRCWHSGLLPSISRDVGAFAARHRNGTLAGVAGLGRSDSAAAVPCQGRLP